MESDRFISAALRRMVVPLDQELALAAAQVSNTTKLAMADSIIYATAQVHQAQLVTGDAAFPGAPRRYHSLTRCPRTSVTGPLALTGLIRASKLVVSNEDHEPT